MEKFIQIIEAMIFASDTPLPAKKIKEVLEEGTEKQIKNVIEEINQNYSKNNSPLQIVEVAGGYQIVTKPDYATWISKLFRTRSSGRLSKRALETMAIVAYKQPITKQEMEAIRGVNVDGVVRTLVERNLITVTGRHKAPGNPLLYGTTQYFLEYFGLKNISDLPKLKEIDELLKSDERFLESLDQVSLQQMFPEELGISSMLSGKTEDGQTAAATAEAGKSTDSTEIKPAEQINLIDVNGEEDDDASE